MELSIWLARIRIPFAVEIGRAVGVLYSLRRRVQIESVNFVVRAEIRQVGGLLFPCIQRRWCPSGGHGPALRRKGRPAAGRVSAARALWVPGWLAAQRGRLLRSYACVLWCPRTRLPRRRCGQQTLWPYNSGAPAEDVGNKMLWPYNAGGRPSCRRAACNSQRGGYILVSP